MHSKIRCQTVGSDWKLRTDSNTHQNLMGSVSNGSPLPLDDSFWLKSKSLTSRSLLLHCRISESTARIPHALDTEENDAPREIIVGK
jgi:hypothetical protein